MKSAHVFTTSDTDFEVKVKDIPVPSPRANQVLIKVAVAGTNPKDWKLPFRAKSESGTNTGDDLAGYIEAVGSNVTEFKVGDRVAAFHKMRTPYGAFGKYAIATDKMTFHLPNTTSFEEAATIPLAAMTAVVGLFSCLGLPQPWAGEVSPTQKDEIEGGIVVYGASSAVGAFAVKLLTHANIHPIICVAGRAGSFVEGLIDRSKGDTVIDYRGGNEKVISEIKQAIPKGQKLLYAFDAVSEHGSYQQIVEALDPQGYITLVLLGESYEEIPKTVHQSVTNVGAVHGFPGLTHLVDFGYVWFRLLSLGLKEGWFTGHPYEIVPRGLEGVQQGLENLKNGKASAIKYVYRIDETPVR